MVSTSEMLDTQVLAATLYSVQIKNNGRRMQVNLLTCVRHGKLNTIISTVGKEGPINQDEIVRTNNKLGQLDKKTVWCKVN